MKAKTRNYGVCALVAAVLLAMAMLVTGCPAEPETEAGYQPPAGMGAVQLNFSKTIHRATYLPSDKTLDDFEDVVISFTGPTVTSKTVEQEDFATKLSEPMPLTPGTYTLLVVARFIAGDDNSIAAYYADTDIEVNASLTLPIEIILRPFIEDFEGKTGKGTFIWAITDSTEALSITINMEVTDISTGDPVEINGGNSDITSTLNNEPTGEALDAGFYYVDITVVADGKTRYFRHILHIYTNMTSTFSYEFLPDHIVLQKIGFTASIDYQHPKEVVATWDVNPETEEGNTIYGTGAVNDPYILSLTDDVYPAGLTFTITNDDPAFDSVRWSANKTVLGTESSFTVDDTVAPFNVAGGPYQLTVTGFVDDVPSLTEIYIVVVD
jgi:hypothetical protein